MGPFTPIFCSQREEEAISETRLQSIKEVVTSGQCVEHNTELDEIRKVKLNYNLIVDYIIKLVNEAKQIIQDKSESRLETENSQREVNNNKLILDSNEISLNQKFKVMIKQSYYKFMNKL